MCINSFRNIRKKNQSDSILITFNCGKDIKVLITTTNLVINQDQRLNYAQIQLSSISTQFIYNQIANCLNSTN
ncbi:unnamed protein product [Rotaria sordida]|uniref:Uncharacterized protein n=1 Tax=Rotaria sordida TaxID=392033 RepID=A0A814K3H6_9BILA|nr:unnamed protein product [Rotaria sordida]CAF3928505.1 unnamed protein product [Rotaria sordida]